jgi:hypothetical protein
MSKIAVYLELFKIHFRAIHFNLARLIVFHYYVKYQYIGSNIFSLNIDIKIKYGNFEYRTCLNQTHLS